MDVTTNTAECAVNSCPRDAFARGWCRGHYQRWYQYGDVREDTPFRMPNPHPRGTECTVKGCLGIIDAKQLCGAHYRRLKVHGDVMADIPLKKQNKGKKCSVKSCKRSAAALEMCSAHYQRWKATGDVDEDRPIQVQELRGSGWGSQNGYIYDTQTRRGQHRIVMEQMIGRSLEPGETVHHKNSLRWDNDPSNLELWVNTQPTGARVVDLLAWAHKIIERYESKENH